MVNVKLVRIDLVDDELGGLDLIPADDWTCSTMVKDEILGTEKDGQGAGAISQGVMTHKCATVRDKDYPDLSLDDDTHICEHCAGFMKFNKSWHHDKSLPTQYYCKCSLLSVCDINGLPNNTSF